MGGYWGIGGVGYGGGLLISPLGYATAKFNGVKDSDPETSGTDSILRLCVRVCVRWRLLHRCPCGPERAHPCCHQILHVRVSSPVLPRSCPAALIVRQRLPLHDVAAGDITYAWHASRAAPAAPNSHPPCAVAARLHQGGVFIAAVLDLPCT